jgi:hypothetical protein
MWPPPPLLEDEPLEEEPDELPVLAEPAEEDPLLELPAEAPPEEMSFLPTRRSGRF